jgi:hypothetical protein
MGCSTGTVKSNLSRGLAKLRRHHLLTDPLIAPAASAAARKEG